MEVKIENSWKEVLKDEFDKEYFCNLVGILHKEKAEAKTIYPPGSLIFNAFQLTPFDKVRVVIIGQDPYHGAGQAHGLSFSVPDGITPPPSLINIYKEIESELGIQMDRSRGNLEKWAEQGVFLLNAVLTVRASEPTSHSKIGWTDFTDAVIKAISSKKEGIIFLLWGNYAKSKKELIDTSKHYVLEAAHPSPLARGAFFGCNHFVRTNEILTARGEKPIDWSI
ncbi:MAG: uracil-DNA glycosylase [Prevotellaceae bacterium]|nr:uracil-DNA glycosylase [Candidatus Faecinaster equi]